MPEELAKDILANAKVAISQDAVCLAHSQSGTCKVCEGCFFTPSE